MRFHRRYSAAWVFGVAGLLTGMALPVHAAPVGTLSLEAATRFALSHQPEYLALAWQVKEAQAQVVQATAWPNPILNVTVGGINPADTSQAQVLVGVTQTVTTGGQIAWKTAIAKQDAKVAELAIALARQNLTRTVSQAYNRLLAATETVAVAQGNLDWQRQLLDLTQQRIKLGELPEFERLRAQIQVAQAQRDLLAAKADQASAQQALNTRIGQPADTPVAPEGPFEPATAALPTGEALLAMAVSQRPELQQSEATRLRARHSRQLAYAQIFTGFDALAGYGTTSGVLGAYTGLNATLPLLYRQDGEIAAATAAQERLQLTQTALVNAIGLQVRDAVRHVDVASQQIAVYRHDLLPMASQMIDLTLQRYRVGDARGQEISEVRKTYRETQAAYVQAVLSYRDARAELVEAIGAEGDDALK